MLILSRKVNEAVVIGEGISIKILRISHDTVKLGVTAPANVPVHRQEVFDLIQKGIPPGESSPPRQRGLSSSSSLPR